MCCAPTAIARDARARPLSVCFDEAPLPASRQPTGPRREDAAFFVKWIERLEAGTRASPMWNSAVEQADVLRKLARARAVFEAAIAQGRWSGRRRRFEVLSLVH